MNSNKKRSSLGWALGISLGLAFNAGVVYAGSISDTYTTGDTLTAAKMDNIKAAVNGNATDITTANGQITTINGQITTINGQITTINNTTIPGINTRVTNLENGTSTCSTGMVRVGPVCVDVYEASVWDAATGGSQATASRCNKTGNDCSANTPATAIFARSVSAATPAAGFTWFQAQQACANVGKRLLTNAEWQMAAAGTDNANCGLGGAIGNTGVNGSCVSNWGVHDMVGNVSEWVADWMQGGVNVLVNATDSAMVATAGATTDVSYGSHGIVGVSVAQPGAGNVDNNFPAAIYRGGDAGDPAGVFFFHANRQPSGASANIGFRCAR